MLSKSNSFHLLRHIHAVIAQKKNNLACSNWRAAFTSLLHIALQLYGAFGKSLSFSAIAFFFIEQDMQWFWLCPKPLIRNLLTWLSWNGRIFSSSSSSLFLHLFFHLCFCLFFHRPVAKRRQQQDWRKPLTRIWPDQTKLPYRFSALKS